MLKTEGRNRSLSFTYTGSSTHMGSKILRQPDAEHLIQPFPIKEFKEENEEVDDFALPCLPSPTNPKEAKQIRILEQITSKFHLTDAHLMHIEKRMLDEVNRGLGKATNRTANVKSFVTYVHEIPSGRESGQYLALDLGGTNFRVILVELEAGSRSVKMKACKHEVSQKLMLGPGEDLFDFMTGCLVEFMKDHDLHGRKYHLGFTFSFPTRQRQLDRAELTHWTKGYKNAGVEGQDVVTLLKRSINKRPELDIQVEAILNDTTGCLLACAYKRPECAIGIILGTGTNASYVEDMNHVELYEGPRPRGCKSVVINTEWGAFGNTGSLDIIRTRYDHDMDSNSLNPGKQVYEKLISGMYLGELTRYILVHAIELGILFDGEAQTLLSVPGGFPTKYISEIEADPTRSTFTNIKQVMLELDISVATDFDLQVVRYICECVSTRAAYLAGAGVASLINKVARRRVTVGMDGSLYKFHPHLDRRMRSATRRLVSDCIQFEMVLSEDGSGRGAALAAAVAEKQRKKFID
uniref:Phosphotransferase n=1 Tax=Tigriopus japonicus TaxID=158387 RepID=A0A3S5X8T9_TIGJA|nr:hexokinase 3 [Tigriopus japonicus]